MGATVTFRAGRTADARACARLHAQAFTHPWSADEFLDQLARHDYRITVAVRREPMPIGFASSRVLEAEADLLTIVVDRASKRRGIGRGLLGHHLSALSAAGVGTVFLEVAARNNAAVTLYEKSGFVRIGVRKGYYPAAGGAREDAITMRRAL